MTDPNRGGARVGTQALSAAISTVLSVASGAAAAQEQPPEVVGLDEVIVTATKRAERLQDVPESISAFDSDDIAMRGLQQIDDVAKYIPGLSLAQREPGRHDHRVPRRGELRHPVRRPSLRRRSTSTSSRSRRAGAARIRASSTSSE